MTKENDMAKPKSFADLDTKELYRSAIEDFAIPVDEADKGKRKVLLAAFVEDGVTFAQYAACHPEVVDEEAAAEAVLSEQLKAGEVITSNAPSHGSVDEPVETGLLSVPTAPVAEPEVNVVVKQPLVVAPADKFLLKMVRENPLFETRGYKFTKEHPYALVAADDAQYILEYEDGFRQALPSELAEFYG